MNTELLEALNILEKEKDISKETLLDAIENSLLNACKNHFGKADSNASRCVFGGILPAPFLRDKVRILRNMRLPCGIGGA